MNINGIHMHTGSDILDIDVFLYASEILFETAKKFKNLTFIDFGSGFKVPYKPNDIETNIEELGEKLAERFNTFCENYGKALTLAFEPGKFIVSQSGYFLTKVNAIKQTTSTVFAQVDSGFNHLIRPMLYGAQHHIENISNPNGKERFYSVVGYICETDTFANNRRIKEIASISSCASSFIRITVPLPYALSNLSSVSCNALSLASFSLPIFGIFQNPKNTIFISKKGSVIAIFKFIPLSGKLNPV
mgnify:CR=1 FL=1